MLRPVLLGLLDRTYRTAWWRFVRRWQPMALWTLLVWLGLGLALIPLSSAALGALVFRGERIVVANVDILTWLLRPEGIAYVLVAGALAITAAVVRYAGIFRIITDDIEGTPVSVPQTLLELLPDVPALFKVCVLSVLAAAVLLAPLVAGLGAIYVVLLAEHDINYYLAVQPPEWHRALVAGGIWSAVWLTGAVYVTAHTLPTLPAYLDGHRPIHRALVESWRRTRGKAMRVLWLFVLCVAAWLLVRALAQAVLFLTAGYALRGVEMVATTLTPVLVATAAYAVSSFLVDAAVSFIGFSFAATVLTKFYHEETDLHQRAPAAAARWRSLPREAVAAVRTWLHPRRAVPVAGVLVLAGAGLSFWLLEAIDDEQPAVVTAHRAGALLATENTLGALEMSIAAGADYAEIDVQRTRDGEVVVVHDADLMRLAGDPRRIAEMDYADVAGVVQGDDPHVPVEERLVATLDQFLARSRGRIGLNVELKYYGPDPPLADSVVAKVRRAGMEDQVVYMSLELDAVRQLQRLAPEVPVGYVAAVAAGDLARLPVDFLAVSLPLATHPFVRSARRRGTEVHIWTLNTAPSILDALERGADGIITDDPALARRLAYEFVALTAPERLLLRLRRSLIDAQETSVGWRQP
jgi:glycerophosphoryl diester phosphodiesterase